MFNEELLSYIVEDAYDEVKRIHDVDLRESFDADTVFNASLAITFAQAITAAAIFNYHYALRDSLLKHGIDIGLPMRDSSD